MRALSEFCKTFGLHPLVGFGMAAVDAMIFGSTVATGGVALAVTVPFAIALSIPCALIQKNSFGDNWGAAIGKGLLVGVLTAIPTPLPAIIPISAGGLGLLARSKSLP
jgi:hypothetical protein